MNGRRALLTLSLIMLAGCSRSASNESADNHFPVDAETIDHARRDARADFETLTDLIRRATEAAPEQAKHDPFTPALTPEQALDVMQQCLRHVLTHQAVKKTRRFYGTRGDCDIVLMTDGPAEWPAGFVPRVDGFSLRFAPDAVNPADAENVDRKLGIRLNKCDLSAPVTGLFDGNIVFSLQNVGGSRNGAVNGGCFVYYQVQRSGEDIVARCAWMFDP